MLWPGEPKFVHNDRLIGDSVRIVAALMAKDIDRAFVGLQAPRLITTAVRFSQCGYLQSLPLFALIGGQKNAIGGDVENDTFACGKQFRMTGVSKRRGVVIIDCP